MVERKSKRRSCKDCVKSWKRRQSKKRMRAIREDMRQTGRKMNTYYPALVWFFGETRFCEKHRAVRLNQSGKRRASKISATPMWADGQATKRVYADALRIQKETGVKQHVDHVVPLRGANVCGLHIAENMQVLPARENTRKSNKFTDGVGGLTAGASLERALPE